MGDSRFTRLGTNPQLWYGDDSYLTLMTVSQSTKNISILGTPYMSRLNEILLKSGIAELSQLYSAEQITQFNSVLGPFFDKKLEEKRSYAHADDLVDLKIWGEIFSSKMMDVLFTIMPDPVLYHAHAYEIAANATRSHIFSDSLSGWHRDPDSAYVDGDATHVSIFIYLTNVGSQDGAFEFVPSCSPKKWLNGHAPFVSVTGVPGYSFAWQRSYYHRASPNAGPVRRRLLKLSIQRNSFPSAHLGNSSFQRVRAELPSGDLRTDLLLGRYQGKQAPQLAVPREPLAAPIVPNSTLNLPSSDVVKAQLRDKARSLKNKLQGQPVTQAAYD